MQEGRARLEELADEELMLRAGRGERDAFEALLRRHESGVVNYLFRLHWDRHRAEDQAQEVFIRLYTHLREYEPTARFTTYLYRIAHNCWVDDLRRRKRERGQLSLDARDEEGTALREILLADSEDPRDGVRKEEVVEAVIRAVDSLADEHKAVFVLSEVQGMRYSDIAEVLGIPEGTVKSRMHAAVAKLRRRLASIAPRGRS
jgi:RNA polymerase sigma-70 factor (ECF subfamily)